MTTMQYVGAALLASPYIVIWALAGRVIGWFGTAIVFGGVALVAVYLVNGGAV